MSSYKLIKLDDFIARKQFRYPSTQPHLFFVLQGRLLSQHDTAPSEILNAGQFAMLTTDQLNDAFADKECDEFQALDLLLDNNILQRFRNAVRHLPTPEGPTTPFSQHDAELQSIIQLLLDAVEHHSDSHLQHHLLLALLSIMVKQQPTLLNTIVLATSMTTTQKVIHYIEDNIEDELTLEVLANYLEVSIATLKRRLSAEGMSFSELLKIKRINYAATALRKTEKSITQIAYDSGFKNAAHFSTAFKSIHNTSPKAFRANIKRDA